MRRNVQQTEVVRPSQDDESGSDIIFQNVAQIDADLIAPTLSALDATRQIYFAVIVKNYCGFLISITTGVSVISGGVAPSKILWQRPIGDIILTSLQIDDDFGTLHGMIYNTTGHYLVQFDSEVIVFFFLPPRILASDHRSPLRTICEKLN